MLSRSHGMQHRMGSIRKPQLVRQQCRRYTKRNHVCKRVQLPCRTSLVVLRHSGYAPVETIKQHCETDRKRGMVEADSAPSH